jgi:hypothetical protein
MADHVVHPHACNRCATSEKCGVSENRKFRLLVRFKNWRGATAVNSDPIKKKARRKALLFRFRVSNLRSRQDIQDVRHGQQPFTARQKALPPKTQTAMSALSAK